MRTREPFLYELIRRAAAAAGWELMKFKRQNGEGGLMETQGLADLLSEARNENSDKLRNLERETGIDFEKYQAKLAAFLASRDCKSTDFEAVYFESPRICACLDEFEWKINRRRENALSSIDVEL